MEKPPGKGFIGKLVSG